ncbi:hypothetical protein BJF79_47135 [Actinomadura sp. CNU-125]|nr:hypothetical protein BJF79_47135 [Actinomadura sp. CNU-125]
MIPPARAGSPADGPGVVEQPAGRAVVVQRGQPDGDRRASAAVRAIGSPSPAVKSVAHAPGTAALTRIPAGRSSLAYWTVSMFSAAFDTGYAAWAGIADM